ncbi:MAG: DUF2567 domain-containing protein [Hamadaea sp.]|nr:DUF2567 domain-containing protein [Hamadaea sp.]
MTGPAQPTPEPTGGWTAPRADSDPASPPPGPAPSPSESRDSGPFADPFPGQFGDPYQDPYAATWMHPEPPKEPRRPLLVTLQALAVLLAALLGFPLGVLWQGLTPDIPVLIVSDGAVYNDSQPEQFISGDGAFALLGFAFGVVLAVIAWVAFRRLRGPLLIALLAVSTTVAAVIAWKYGRELGLAAYQDALHSSAAGTQIFRPNDLRVEELRWWPPAIAGVLLVPALGATLAVTLLAAWSRWPSLRAPRATGTPEELPLAG